MIYHLILNILHKLIFALLLTVSEVVVGILKYIIKAVDMLFSWCLLLLHFVLCVCVLGSELMTSPLSGKHWHHWAKSQACYICFYSIYLRRDACILADGISSHTWISQLPFHFTALQEPEHAIFQWKQMCD